MKKFLLYSILVLPFLLGCGDKFDTNLLGVTKGPINSGGDTVYVALNPPWGGFNNPQAILMGKEPFIYVCDTDNDRVVMMNTAGTWLGTISIPHPIAIAQDYRLNLIVCGQFDSTFNNGTKIRYSAVYKIDVYTGLSAANPVLANAPVKRILPRSVDIDNHPNCQYTAVTAFYDNSYFVARTGSNNGISDPDNALMQFAPIDHNRDSALSIVHDIDPVSSSAPSANGINSLTSFSKKNFDFIATLSGAEVVLRAQWFHHFVSAASEGYQSQFKAEATGFSTSRRFGHPSGSCIDANGNIFIADSDPAKDSVFKFNSYGDELQSFGGPGIFVKPTGVAFFDKTLYVLDAGKNQILRFILSTDTQ